MENNQPTSGPKEEADLQERINSFNKELPALLGKYELGLAAQAHIAPNGLVVADPVLISARNLEKPIAKPKEPELSNPEL